MIDQSKANQPHFHSGFTLIEILIVLVIISIVSSVAILTVSHNQNKNLENLAHELQRVILLAEQEAMLRPATLGLALTSTSFQFYQYTTRWVPLSTPILGMHHFPATIQLQLKINHKIIPLNTPPVLIISASGDLTPFIILIGKKEAPPRYAVIGYANGQVNTRYIDEK